VPGTVFALFRVCLALVSAVAAGFGELAEDVGGDPAQDAVQDAGHGDDVPAADLVADGVDGDGEGDAAGVEAGDGGGAGFQRAQRVVDGQHRPQFLADQFRGPGAQGEPGALEPGLELLVGALAFPALVIQRGDLRRGCLVRVEQAGGQPERLGAGLPAGGGDGDGVVDDADQAALGGRAGRPVLAALPGCLRGGQDRQGACLIRCVSGGL